MCLSHELLHACQTALVLFLFVFLCVVVSHLRPHRLLLALCNVNCVRTNVLFWVLIFLLYLFKGLIIYLIGSRVG